MPIHKWLLSPVSLQVPWVLLVMVSGIILAEKLLESPGRYGCEARPGQREGGDAKG